jgi:hypothetical protein
MLKKSAVSNLKNFDFDTNRSIYLNCCAVNCPNQEIGFIGRFFKKGFSVLFVAFNQPCEKVSKRFKDLKIKTDKITFIDCVSKEKKPLKNVIYTEHRELLTNIKLKIDSIWGSMKGKKLLFFDCAEYLLEFAPRTIVFRFVQDCSQNLQKDGIVIFCFLNGTTDAVTEKN